MACAVRSLNISTGSVGTTQSITGLSFAPDFLIIVISGRTESTDAVGRADIQLSMGVADIAGNRRVSAMRAGDNLGTSSVDSSMDDDCVVQCITSAGASDGKLDVDAWLSDGVRFIVDEVFPASYRAHVILLSGITASFATFTDTGNGSQDVTGLGNDLEAVLFLSGFVQTPPYLASAGGFSFGAAANLGGTIQQAVLSTRALDNDASPNALGVCKGDTAFYSQGSSGTVSSHGPVTARISDGVTVTVSNSGPRSFYVVGLKGASIRVVELATQTDTSTLFGSGSLGFAPAGGLVISSSKTESSTTASVDAAGSIGLWDAASQQRCVAWMYDDGSDPSVCGTANGEDDIYLNLPNTADAIEGAASIDAVGGDSVDFVMTDADPSSFFGWALIFEQGGAAAEEGTVSDGGAFSDAISASAAAFGSVLDGLGAGDAQPGLASALDALVDGAGLGDLEAAIAAAQAAVVDGIAAGEAWAALSGALAQLIDEAAFGDAQAALSAALGALSDAVAAGDSQSALAAAQALLGEGVALGDTISAADAGLETASNSDGARLGDALSAISVALGAASEGSLLGDLIEVLSAGQGILIESIRLGDTVSASAQTQAEVQDGLAGGDISAFLAAAILVSASIRIGGRPVGVVKIGDGVDAIVRIPNQAKPV